MFLYLLFALLIAAISGIYAYHRWRFNRFYAAPAPHGASLIRDGRRVFYRLKGQGPVVLVDPALGSPSAEWWAVQDRLADQFTVLTYDRAGYGWSDQAGNERTPKTIAQELHALVTALDLKPPFILLGHSQGGLNLRHFATLYPEQTLGCVFLDPLSPLDNDFKSRLTKAQFTGGGIDKSAALKTLRPLATSGFLRLMKTMILKSPPFYYYREVSDEAIEAVWQHLNRPGLLNVVGEEYEQAHVQPQTDFAAFPPVPLFVLFHQRQVLVDEMKQYGGLSEDDAVKVDEVWEEIVREYLSLSPHSQWVAVRGGHFIHMNDLPALQTALQAVAAFHHQPTP